MFPIPNVPADSLYKFIFITGILLIIFSFYMKTGIKRDLERLEYTRDSLQMTSAYELYLDSINLKTLIDEAKTLKGESNFYNNLQAKVLNRNSTSLGETKLIESKLKALKVKNQRLTIKIENARSENLAYLKYNENLSRRFEREQTIKFKTIEEISVYFWVGLGSFCFGIVLWYSIVQRSQDIMNDLQVQILKVQLIKEQNSLTSIPTQTPNAPSDNNDKTNPD